MSRGLFLVIEGLDGSGGETQSRLVRDFLQSTGKAFESINYPDYTGHIGKVIDDFLHKKVDFPVEVEFSLFLTDFLKDKSKVEDALKEGKIVIADRYLTSTLAYQTLKGFPLQRGLNLAELLELPKPDLVIFLDVSPETSIERKFKEKNILDRHEENKEFLGRVRNSYRVLIDDNVFAKEWVVVNAEKSIEEVAKEVQAIIMKKL